MALLLRLALVNLRLTSGQRMPLQTFLKQFPIDGLTRDRSLTRCDNHDSWPGITQPAA